MLRFLREYIKTPNTIGAIAPSSRRLAAAMTDAIDFGRARCIVEYGAGTGVFTRQVAARKRPDTVYIVIEKNERFYEMLLRQFQGMPGVALVHGDAGDVCRFLNEHRIGHADYIISGLPFTSLPEQASRRILAQTRKAIGEEGVFVTFQYTLLRKKFLESYFCIQRIVRVWRNLPPAYVLQMRPECSRKGNLSARQP